MPQGVNPDVIISMY